MKGVIIMDKIEEFLNTFNKTYNGKNYKSTLKIDNSAEDCEHKTTNIKHKGFEKIDSFIKEFNSSCFYREPTFMEITKYPHYEKVCSNILSFYFDIHREHNFGDLILKSFLMAANIEINNIEQIEVFTEYRTAKGNSIDLVLYNDDFVIGIENKINAPVYNNLEDYAETIKHINNKSYKIILSLNDETAVAKDNNYINVTYDKFLNNVEELTKEVWDNNNKWHIFLREFITTIQNLKGEF